MRDEIEFGLPPSRALRAIPEPAMRRECLLERLVHGDRRAAHELLSAILGAEARPREPLRETALLVLQAAAPAGTTRRPQRSNRSGRNPSPHAAAARP